MGQQQSVSDLIFDLKLNAKKCERQANMYLKKEALQKKKVAEMVKAGDSASARIYAELAISCKKQYLQMLKMSSKMEAIASRVKSADRNREMQPLMKKTCQQLNRAMTKLNLEKLGQEVSAFEQAFGELDVRDELMNRTVGGAVGNLTPLDEVDALLQKVGDEHNLDVANLLSKNQAGKGKIGGQVEEEGEEEEEDLDEKLKKGLDKLRATAA
eukprot:g3177.t1